MKRFPSVDTSLGGPVVDCHQHVWPEALLEALRRRVHAPRLVGWTLHLDGEPEYDVDPSQHDLQSRRKTNVADRIDLALLSLSSPLGIESMPADERTPLIAAWHTLADDLDDGYGLWASTGLVEPDLDDVAAVLRHPRVYGLQVPATAMAHPAAIEALCPILAVAEAADRPVLVHPGPSPATDAAAPPWWPALTSYTAQLTAAWFAWHIAGRSMLPLLRIAFVGLAGLAPLHHERLTQRGGRLGGIDRHVYYETSSYGTRAIDAMTRVVGVDPLVHGSDRPYADPTDPGLGEAFSRALLVANPHHLLTGGLR